MKKEIISTSKAPSAIGPYSQAVRWGDFVFVSGQIPMDPSTGEIVGEDVREQTQKVLENLQAVLEAGGASLAHVVKATVYMVNLSDFSLMNEVYASFFKSNPPARAAVQVARLPKDVLVEIDAIALTG